MTTLPISLIPELLPVPNRRESIPMSSTPASPVQPLETVEEIGIEKEEEVVNDEDRAADMQVRLTLRELKDMCTNKSLSSVGKKGELVARILAHDRSNSEA